jgi:molybdate transport system substrate-binding protein
MLLQEMIGMKKIVIFFVFGMVAGLVLGLPLELLHPYEQKRIEVFCGAAASPVYEDAAKLFESEHDINVDLTLGGSGSVLSAMRITKRGDLFIPGSPEYLLKAQELGVVDNSTEVTTLAYMVPAIIVQKGNPENDCGLS